MSVTRNIKANEATQVNSNLIGVQVHPSVTLINFRFRYNKYFVNNGIYYGIDGVNYVYRTYPPVSYEGQDYYRLGRQSLITDTPSTLYFKGVDNTSRPETGDAVYTFENGVPVEYSTVGQIVEWNSGTVEFYQIENEENGFIKLFYADGKYYGEVSTVDYVVNIKNASEEKVDIALTSKQNGNEAETATYDRELDGLYQWLVEGEKIGTQKMVTDNRNPLVGEKVRFEDENNGLLKLQYPYTIQGTENENLDCKVEYSIDGKTFTGAGDNLTDVNNVIANVPRYVYLRFGQEVEITEE